VFVLLLWTSDPSCTDPMPIYAQLTKGRNIFVGQSSSAAIHDESSMDGPPTRRGGGESKVAECFCLCVKLLTGHTLCIIAASVMFFDSV